MDTFEDLQKENAALRKELAALRAQVADGGSGKQQHGAANHDPNACKAEPAANGVAACTSCPGQWSAAAMAAEQGPSALAKQQAAQPQVAASDALPLSSTCAYQSLHGLTKAQVERYSRQLLLPSFGIAAQGKLCSSSILIVGCGGLGSPAALYLAAAGVGRLGLVDHDVVELSNMHRQVIHSEARLGMHKAHSAAAAVAGLNSCVAVQCYLEGLTPSNAVAIVSQYDVVVDASDNPPTRYLINDACVACGVPLVSAAAVGTDGQLTVYNYGPDSPCYRCLFPECPAAGNCARCADAGVLGPVPGVMGVLQAIEAIKVVSGAGAVLAGKLLLYDALAGRFSTIKLRGKAPGCVACGQAAVISRDSVASYDYTTFTGGQRPNDGPPVPLAVLPAEQRITAQQLQEQLHAEAAGGSASSSAPQQQQQPLLLDVRPPEQFAVMSLPGAVNIPYLQFDKQWQEVLQLCGGAAAQHQGKETTAASDNAAVGTAANGSSSSGSSSGMRPVYVMCRRGNHSQLAVERLRQAGVAAAVDVIGGYEAWAAEVDGGMPVL